MVSKWPGKCRVDNGLGWVRLAGRGRRIWGWKRRMVLTSGLTWRLLYPLAAASNKIKVAVTP